MEKVKAWLRQWLGVVSFKEYSFVTNDHERRISGFKEQLNYISGSFAERDWVNKHSEVAKELDVLTPQVANMQGQIDDLEAAYPDYNKAKEQAEENKAKEIVPGFRPFTQRKKAWEAQHRKPAEKK